MILLSHDLWEIKKTEKKGRGVFATKDIPAGTIIGDYIGKVIKTAEEDTYESDEGLYLMYYHDYASLYPIDIGAPGVHLINHACAPNCWMYTYKGHTLFFALRHIFAGEELTVSYLLSPDITCDPCLHICKCEGLICYQTMHLSKERFEEWNEVNLELSEKTKRERIRYGKELPLLSSYPKTISDHPVYLLAGSAMHKPLICDDKKLPSKKVLRKLIRESGRTLLFPALKIKVLGVEQDRVISESF